MNDTDGLYIDGVLVGPADDMALTIQANDLTKPATVQASYTSEFALPDSQTVRKLLANAEQLDSASPAPYTPIPAYVRAAGENILSGVMELTGFQGGWNGAIYEEKRDLFSRLDRSIRTADLSRYNHKWTVEEINKRATAIDGYCYPVIDYGMLKENKTPLALVSPAVYFATVLEQMLYEEGYTLVGDLRDNPLYKSLIIPFSEDTPTSKDEDFKTDRTSRVTVNTFADDTVVRNATGKKGAVDRIQPYNNDNAVGFSQGKLKNFNLATHTYVCDTDVRLIVEAFQLIKIRVNSGSVEVKLIVDRNGRNVYQEYQEYTTGYNLLNMRTDTISLKETIDCKRGDRIRIRLTIARRTALGAYSVTVYNNADNSFANFSPDLELAVGDNWPVARNLPDVSGLDLLKAIAHIQGGFWQLDRVRKQVRLISLTGIISNEANAVDYSDRLDTSVEPQWVPRLDPYAQVNFLRWRENEEAKKAAQVLRGVTLNYGDGRILVDATVLEPTADLFTLAFESSTLSDSSLPGYGNPVLIKTRTQTKTDVQTQAAGPRLLLAYTGPSVPVQATRLKDDGVTVETLTVNLKPCWFGPRPTPVMGPDTNYCLCFEPVPGNKGERTLIAMNYTGLSRVLRRPRVLTVGMSMRPDQLATFDPGKPVKLGRVEVGSLVLNPGLYYLNKIDSYVIATGLCNVTLVAF